MINWHATVFIINEKTACGSLLTHKFISNSIKLMHYKFIPWLVVNDKIEILSSSTSMASPIEVMEGALMSAEDRSLDKKKT